MPTNPIPQQPVRDLSDIRRRKEELRRQLSEESTTINKKVNALFTREANVSPVKRITGLMTNAGTSIDMALLGWKLYRKLNPSKKKKKKTQRHSWMLWKK